MKKPSPKTARINVRIPPVLHERLVRYGREEGIGDLSDTCRQILTQAMTGVFGRAIGAPGKLLSPPTFAADALTDSASASMPVSKIAEPRATYVVKKRAASAKRRSRARASEPQPL